MSDSLVKVGGLRCSVDEMWVRCQRQVEYPYMSCLETDRGVSVNRSVECGDRMCVTSNWLSPMAVEFCFSMHEPVYEVRSSSVVANDDHDSGDVQIAGVICVSIGWEV